MAYPALPDRRMPYDNDGTVVYVNWVDNTHYEFFTIDAAFEAGPGYCFSGAERIALNDAVAADLGSSNTSGIDLGYEINGQARALWIFFPESREVTAAVAGFRAGGDPLSSGWGVLRVQGSADTTNGMDGTWETATYASAPHYSASLHPTDGWRDLIKAISFTGAKRAIRLAWSDNGGTNIWLQLLHLYGQKAAGQTPDDILFLDGLISYAEFTAPEDFGDRPLGTTLVRTFKVKNGSATKTANTINLQCNDADFVISTDNVTWVTTINIGSLAAGASSAVLYVRNTSPAIGSPLGPRFARVIATVASYT